MAVLSPCTDIKTLIEHYANIQVVGRPAIVHGVLEYHSNCPFCGGEDRFITRPEEGTYSCKIRETGCDAGGDMITFLREYCGMKFWEACEEIGVDPSELGDYTRSTPAQSYGAPNKTWQERGASTSAKAYTLLRTRAGATGLEYWHARGVTNDTILDKGLGYIPCRDNRGGWYSEKPELWGLDTGGRLIYLYEGILIPWHIDGKLWKIDIRRVTGLGEDDPKILSIKGSVDCLYNHDAVTPYKPVVLVESALCALTGEQEAGDLATFVATGGAGKHRPAWARHLEEAPFVLIALDNDEPDERGVRPGDEGADWWEENLSCCIRWHPWQKDINDMLRAGRDIREWVQDGIDFYKALQVAKNAPIPVGVEAHADASLRRAQTYVECLANGFDPGELPALNGFCGHAIAIKEAFDLGGIEGVRKAFESLARHDPTYELLRPASMAEDEI